MSRVHPSGDDKEGQAAGRRNTLSGSWTTVDPTLIRVEDWGQICFNLHCVLKIMKWGFLQRFRFSQFISFCFLPFGHQSVILIFEEEYSRRSV